MTDQSTA